MLEKFRSLPPFLRIVSVLLGFAVLLGIVAILVGFFSGTASAPAHTKAPVPGGPNPSISIKVTPRPTLTASPSPTPNASLKAELSRANDDATSSKKITDADRQQISQNAEAGYTAWCSHDSHSASTATGVENKYFANLDKYYTKDSSAAQRGNYLTFIKDQVCNIHAGQPDKVLSDGSVTYVLFSSIATVYEDGTPAHTANKAYVSNSAATLYLKKISGKWLITRLITTGASS